MSSAGYSSEAATAPKPTLTDRELEILKHAWSSLKSAPEVDYPKLAAACGMSNHRSASNAWLAIKKKLFADLPAQGSDSAGNSPAKRKIATPSKRKAAAATSSDDADELAAGANLNSDGEEKLVVESPVKKKRATPAKKKAAATPKAAAKTTGGDEDADEDAEPETPVKKKAIPAKRKTPAKGKKAAAAEKSAPENQDAAGAAAENKEADGEDAPAADVAKLAVRDWIGKEENVEMSGGPDAGGANNDEI
ncbi:hypothetical protein CSAL01_10895 [Colletotrichum salicis]|uniref:Uncharacterized protein n=1 Tax=Colletotrichum salicis TaxID=1209931 RepID=A0A135UUN8_9PEZI|nr:hypothetical protein CSAL01_10895 [Colletotrichum salicis]